MPNIRAAGSSVTGRVRKSNEDAFRIYMEQDFVAATGRPLVFSLADGMGSYRSAAEAAWMAVDQLAHFYHLPQKDFHGEDTLLDLVFRTNDALLRLHEQTKQHYGMGCTLSLLMLTRASLEAVALHAGDSNIYILRGKELRRLSTPHVNEKGALTRHLGMGRDMQLERTRLKLRRGDRLLLCSDGIDSQVPLDQCQKLLAGGDNPQHVADRLCQASVDLGGKDNATALVVFVDGSDAK